MTLVAAIAVFCIDADKLADVQQRVAKLYGGGVGRVEAYGTGVLVSPYGHVLTVLSPMLQTDSIRVVLADGRRREAKVVSVDSVRQLAILKIDASRLAFFDLREQGAPDPGDGVYAIGNAFNIAAGDEPLSVQRGTVAGRARLNARVGVREIAFPDEMLLLDAAVNNPGSAGGALVDAKGRFVGLLGKELKDSASETWIHYAVPTEVFKPFVERTIANQKSTPEIAKTEATAAGGGLRGIIPLPEVLDRTPPYVDGVEADSPAANAGLQPDDLIVFVGEQVVRSLADLRAALARAPRTEPVKLVVQRSGTLLTLELPAEAEPKK
jgi:serine protease Do